MFGCLSPVYADRVLDSVVALGLMGGALSGGAFAGTLLFAWRGHPLPRVKTLVLAFTVGGALRFFVLAAEPGLVPILVWNVLAGIGIGAVNPILGTLQYERVPERLRGRVFGAVTAGVLAAAPFGALLAAGCVDLLGLRATLVAFGRLRRVHPEPPRAAGLARGSDRRSSTRPGEASRVVQRSASPACTGCGQRPAPSSAGSGSSSSPKTSASAARPRA